MKSPSDEQLMRYFDGEVEGEEAREVERWLERSEEARRVLSGLEQVGDAVRLVGNDIGVGGDGIADAVMAQLDGAGAKSDASPGFRRGGGAARSRARRRWLRMTPALGLLTAAAAVLALYFRSRPVPPAPERAAPPAGSHSSPSPSVLASAPPVNPASEDDARGAAIESVDFGAVAGTIFMVPSGSSSDEPETPVVWLMDEPAPDEGRMAPL